MTLWGSRFSGKLDPSAWALNASLPFDQRLALQDIARHRSPGRRHSAKPKCSPARKPQASTSVCNLSLRSLQQGAFTFAAGDEDIHTAVERRLGEIIGPAGGQAAYRAQPQRPGGDRLPPVAAASHPGAGCRPARPASRAAAARRDGSWMRSCPATPISSAPSRSCSPTGGSRHFWPLQRDRQRLADLRRRTGGPAPGQRRPGGHSLPGRPLCPGAFPGLRPSVPEQPGRRLRSRLRRRVPVLRRPGGRAPQPPGRSRDALHQRRVRLLRAVGRLRHRLQPDAAEEEPGCLRAGAWQIRRADRLADRAAGHAQRAALHLRQGSAGG